MTGLETLALLISSIATTTLAANVLYLGTYALVGAGLYLASGALAPDKPTAPKPADGAYNLKQNVPPRAYVLGRVKKGGDYVFLEENAGTAYHIMAWAAHRIQGFVTHYAHDESLTVDGSGFVTNKFTRGSTKYVKILARNGLNAETAYSDIVTAFTTIWGSAYRGDGVASVMMSVKGVSAEHYTEVFPNQMPEHSAIGDGALLYDPRKDSTQGGSGGHRYDDDTTWEFTRNLALMRLWHLCHPVGGKLPYTAMHLPDWANAADVCDELVLNVSGGTEPRYHGGLWFRANNDPTEIGRTIDEAAELVVYERPDGKIGVHPGKYVSPTITFSASNIFSLKVDKNRRKASNVLAVRGRWSNPAKDYNTEDAAIYGDPYGENDDGTERTKTFDNSAIQSHNHCQRKQKLVYIRSNARKVSVIADYTAANVRLLPTKRFVRVHYPSRGLVNAVVEVTSTPTIDLRNMRISFSGIIVTSSLYDFNASLEEGTPGASAPILASGGVPTPTGFAVTIQTEVVAGGSTAAFAVATWDGAGGDIAHEFEFERTSGSTGPQSVYVSGGIDTGRTSYLADGVEYKFRLRAYGGSTPSAWTSYETLTATADPTPPGVVVGASATGGAGQASFAWTAPNSGNYRAARLYINTSNTFTGATLVATEYGPPNISDGRVVTGLTAGTKYGFVVAINASGVASANVATGSFVVT